MTFEQRLAARAREIEAGLDQALSRRLDGAHDVPPRLAQAMRHAVMSGGKRIRPFLLLETATMLGAAAGTALPAALALELVHCYSLVHDDLPAMDNDAMRRGQPTVWKAFDDWTAILAGDALLTLAFECVAGQDSGKLPPGRSVALVRELARAAGSAGMVGGQCLDLEADKLGRPAEPTAAHVGRLQAMKTGALFRFACHAGGLIAAASPAQERWLLAFGDKLGAAFQLADDLLDAEGEAGTVGKATGKDAAAGKATLVGLMGVAEARRRLAAIEAAALADLAPFGPRADVLREAMHFAVSRRS